MPNFWVPRDVVEGREPAIAVAEQIVQQLYRRLVAAKLAPHDDAFIGAEYWCQIYEKGRGLGFHFDKASMPGATAADRWGQLFGCACTTAPTPPTPSTKHTGMLNRCRMSTQ